MIPQGYKQTEIGVIPEDWDCVAAKHLMKIETGSRNTEHKTDIGKYPFFVRSQKVERIDTYHYDCEAVLTAGDGVGTGKVFHHYIGKFDAHQRVYVMSNFDGITGRYFYNYFSENFGNEVSKYTAKSSVDSVRRDMIAEMLIPLPSLPEQESIAEALSDVDSMISSLEKLIAKKKAVKQGAMQELLTGKKRLPGFTGEWMSILFKNIYEFAKEGGTPSTSNVQYYHNGKIPFIKIEHLFSKYIEAGKEFITEEGLNNSSAWLIPTESIIFSNGATIGEISINKIPVSTKQGILGIIPKELFSTEFLFYYLSHQMFLNSVKSVTTHGTMNVAYLKDMNNILLYVPKDKKEQIAIATCLADIDNEIEALEQKLEKARHIKQGMMQQLLTGKIRLV